LLGIVQDGFAQKQTTYFPLDTLSKDDIKLEQINRRTLNWYQFKTTIHNDSVYYLLPTGLPRGYYEAYYDNDTSKLALAYYNFGWSGYSQQFYKNGAMKSDTEYNGRGLRDGLHVIYARNGEEQWHAEFEVGALDRRYRLDYLEVENMTKVALKSKKAFGVYEFLPTPSRARKDRIILRADSTFEYVASSPNCDFCQSYQGDWTVETPYLLLTIRKKGYWRKDTRRFAITASPKLTNLELVEVKDWGVEWYNSEYRKKK